MTPARRQPDSSTYRSATPRRRQALVLRGAALVSALALAVSACTGSDSADDPTKAPASVSVTAAPTPQGLGEIYAQQLAWTDCENDLQCASVTVPLDWDDPDGDTIQIAVARHRATGDRIGSLLINPGGPGGSGIDALSTIAMPSFGEQVVASYDLVGFDPRGVGQSTAVDCVDGPQMDELVSADYDFSTDKGIAQAEQAYAALGEACLKRTGPLLEHVDTVSAARDMDVLRAVLGDETLTYVGYSYGTELGATYAALFPDKVGRLVLDGAVDPTLSDLDLSRGQAAGFENALRAYVADCQAGTGCPLTGSVDDGMAQVADVMERARRTPLPTGTDRALTGSLAFSGIAVTLYDEASWSYLTMGLAEAIDSGQGSVLLQLADIYNDRASDGTYTTNSMVAFWSIGCADARSTADVAQMRADAAEIEAAAPTVGSYFGYGGVLCAQWPVPEAGGLDDYSAAGSAPIVVIGTTNDPATPYEWAESLTATLDSATLLTYEGEGHTAYGRSNSCVGDAVDAYLIDGTVPAEGTRC